MESIIYNLKILYEVNLNLELAKVHPDTKPSIDILGLGYLSSVVYHLITKWY